MTTLAALKHYARHPTIGLRRVGYKLYELTHPDEPWIAQGAIRFCEASLTREMAGFEWGSGRSTAWFAQRLGSLTSIEHDTGWFKIVQEKLKRRSIHNVTYRLVPLNHPLEKPHRPFLRSRSGLCGGRRGIPGWHPRLRFCGWALPVGLHLRSDSKAKAWRPSSRRQHRLAHGMGRPIEL
jgi:hypothetical protein